MPLRRALDLRVVRDPGVHHHAVHAVGIPRQRPKKALDSAAQAHQKPREVTFATGDIEHRQVPHREVLPDELAEGEDALALRDGHRCSRPFQLAMLALDALVALCRCEPSLH